MPPDIPGVGATPRLLPSSPIGPAVSPGTVPPGPIGPVTPSTAVVPVVPTGARSASAMPSPLGRSGLDLFDILDTTDVLVERSVVAPVALDVGLETARGALLRGLAAESLATLDGVWERAQLTEEGWYLRSGALTVLGLPGEAERVSTEALQLKPSSIALRFVQSLARLAAGDVPGARSAIAAAIDQQTTHPVLLMQQVIVLARQGNRAESERLLQQVMRVFPEHPAIEFARSALRAIAADHTRSASRSAFGGRVDEPSPFTTGDHEVFEAFGAVSRGVERELEVPGEPLWRGAADEVTADAPQRGTRDTDDRTIDGAADDVASGNVAERALARLGARFAALSVTDAVREGRVLIRAFSAGGSMAGTCTPEQAHAARGILTAIVFALNNAGGGTRATDGASPLDVLISQWLPLMQAERFGDAARVLRRLGASIPDVQRRLLSACSQMKPESTARDDREPSVRTFGTGEYEALVQGEPVKGPLIPVRLGLALLEERSSEHAPDRLAERPRDAGRRPSGESDRAVWSRTPNSTRATDPIWGARSDEPARALSGWIEHPRALTMGTTMGTTTPSRVTPNGLAIGAVDADGRGWGAAMSAASLQPRPRDEGASMRIAALLCVIIAAGAGMSGAGTVAVAFGIGAAWLGLRRSGRSHAREDALPDARRAVRRDRAGDRDTTGAD
ncbi:hypothetical protein [Gemmatimonas groenlandica]|uniref:hypothetical protein n=1 Tax=Gemmatimonas groenlandica TaxID=2732249 RepID=UPI001E2C982C|nr:hypothetical protein [Gemmatimonas groenlandica]